MAADVKEKAPAIEVKEIETQTDLLAVHVRENKEEDNGTPDKPIIEDTENLPKTEF